jgi:hypothetical protein
MGLVIILLRVAILGGVVFGIFFGISYARRSAKQQKQLAAIRKDLLALKAGLENGTYDKPTFDDLTADIYRKCEEQGIDVPQLPE